MSSKVIENMSLDLAIKVAKMCQALHDEGRKDIIADRLLNSCVTVGVYMHDYEYAEPTKDMIKYLNLALSELKFTTYWLDLIYETGGITYDVYNELFGEFSDFNTGIKEAIGEMI